MATHGREVLRLLDKDVAIRKPKESGTLCYNFNVYFSIVLLAPVNANYKFMWADIGAKG